MQTFNQTRNELFDYISRYYPEVYSDFNDMSVGTMFIDLLSYLNTRNSTALNSHLNETNVNDAQLYHSLVNIAKKQGIKISGKSASTTIINISVKVPVKGDAPDLTYAPIIVRGAQFTGGGQSFESLYDIDFTSPFSRSGSPNRTITPIYVNNQITSYEIVKSELIINGISKYFIKEISVKESKPYYEIILPDSNVLEVTDIITKNGSNLSQTPSLSDLYDDENRWEKVDNLSQQYVFKYVSQMDEEGYTKHIGDWIKVNKRYVTEYTDKFFLKIIFGGGKLNESYVEGKYEQLFNEMLELNNKDSMGSILEPNTTLYVKYRIGGGKISNVGSNVIKSIGTANIFISGANQTVNSTVRETISVTNPIPAFGGNDSPSLEDLRNIIKRNGINLNTFISEKDFESAVFTMPPNFGRPYKVNSTVIDNKMTINVLVLNEENKASLTIPTSLLLNLKNYLAGKKSPSTYIEILPTSVINYSINLSIYIDQNIDRIGIETEIKEKIEEWSLLSKRNIGQNIMLTELETIIGSIIGVISLNSLEIKHKTLDQYSFNVPSIGVNENLVLNSSNKTIYANYDELFELRYPERDININYTN